jgi:hypothetical protein
MPASARWIREGILGRYEVVNVKTKAKARSAADKPKLEKTAKTSGRKKQKSERSI